MFCKVEDILYPFNFAGIAGNALTLSAHKNSLKIRNLSDLTTTFD